MKCGAWRLQCELCSVKEAVGSEKCEVWRKQWEVRSVKCGVWSLSLECEARSVKCEVWGLECEGSSGKWEVWSVDCEVRSVKCEVWSVKFQVRSAKSAVWSVECEDFASSLAEKIKRLSREGHGRDRVSLNYRSFMFGKLPPPACPGLCNIMITWHDQRCLSWLKDLLDAKLQPSALWEEFVNLAKGCLTAPSPHRPIAPSPCPTGHRRPWDVPIFQKSNWDWNRILCNILKWLKLAKDSHNSTPNSQISKCYSKLTPFHLVFIVRSSCFHLVLILRSSRIHLAFILWTCCEHFFHLVHLVFISCSSRVHLVFILCSLLTEWSFQACHEPCQKLSKQQNCHDRKRVLKQCSKQESSNELNTSNNSNSSTLLNHSTDSTVRNPPGLSRWQCTGSQRALRAAPTVKQWDPARFSARKRKKLPGLRWFGYVWIQFGFSLDDCNQF